RALRARRRAWRAGRGMPGTKWSATRDAARDLEGGRGLRAARPQLSESISAADPRRRAPERSGLRPASSAAARTRRRWLRPARSNLGRGLQVPRHVARASRAARGPGLRHVHLGLHWQAEGRSRSSSPTRQLAELARILVAV